MKSLRISTAVLTAMSVVGEGYLVYLFAANAIHASYLHGEASNGPAGAAAVFGFLAFFGLLIVMGLFVATASLWDAR